MKKIAILLLAFASLSFLSFSANAGHYVVKCYKKCEYCKKVCKKRWVEDHRRHYHYYRHY